MAKNSIQKSAEKALKWVSENRRIFAWIALALVAVWLLGFLMRVFRAWSAWAESKLTPGESAALAAAGGGGNTTPAALVAAGENDPLKLSSPMLRGETVKALQILLNNAGASPKLVEDGVYGPITAQAHTEYITKYSAADRSYRAALAVKPAEAAAPVLNSAVTVATGFILAPWLGLLIPWFMKD